MNSDHPRALSKMKTRAEQGDADAQANLGQAYITGEGVEDDHEQAVHWYRLAADQGDASAQYGLGLAYRFGEGVEEDHEQAVHWFRLAAEQGNALATELIKIIREEADELPQKTAQIIEFPNQGKIDPSEGKDLYTAIAETSINLDDFKATIKNELREEILSELRREFTNVQSDSFSISQLVSSGESQTLEYKETFSFNTREKKPGDDNLRFAVLKEVAVFLNTKGGLVLIGVSDDQKVTGIEVDDFRDAESYVRKISQTIASALGEVAATLTKIEIHEHEEKQVCAITCEKSGKPIFCDYKNRGQQTFVLYGNVTVAPPPSEWLEYCKHHFE